MHFGALNLVDGSNHQLGWKGLSSLICCDVRVRAGEFGVSEVVDDLVEPGEEAKASVALPCCVAHGVILSFVACGWTCRKSVNPRFSETAVSHQRPNQECLCSLPAWITQT